MTIAYITHHDCQLHDMGDHHPEQPARLGAINDRMIATGLERLLHHFDAPRATREQLLLAHSAEYIDAVFAATPQEGLAWLDADTAMNNHSLDAALHAAGAGVMAVDLIMQNQVQQAFCAIRPPGHHAERNRAMGFCIFNNIAIAAYHALHAHGLKRVAIIDIDVHHGNGTEDIVSGDERILFCSSFQHPFYPFCGADSTAANVINVPLPARTDGVGYRSAVQPAWMPRLAEFAPEIIFISAGFDAHRADDMAHFNLVEADYTWITRRLCDQARESAHGRIVSMLEGGYNLHALGLSVEAHVKAFLKAHPHEP